MLNQVVLVGKIDTELNNETLNNDEELTLILSIQRSFKNNNREYITDYVKCILYKDMIKNVLEYCKKGDLVGIKGRIECLSTDIGQIVHVEKLTFLSSTINQ